MSELEKMKEIKKESQIIGEFLDKMQSKGIVLCEYIKRKVVCDEFDYDEKREEHEHDWECYNFPHDGHQPLRKNVEQLLAEYFEIDLNKAEKERVKILGDFRRKKE